MSASKAEIDVTSSFVFSRKGDCVLVAGMSYLFVAYLWEKTRFARSVLEDVWRDAEPRFPGEQLVHVTVNSRVEAAFYFPGNFRTKTAAFSYGCEVMLMDGYAEAPVEDRKEVGDYDFRYVVWLSSDMFKYDVVLRYEGDSFDGRAIIEGEGERVSVEEDKVNDYAFEKTAVNVVTFNADGTEKEVMSEADYFREVDAREKPFSPRQIISETLKVTRQEVIQALHNAWDGKGRVLWPEGGPNDTEEMRKELAAAEPFMPGLPLWTEWGEQFVPPQTPVVTKSKKPRNPETPAAGSPKQKSKKN